MFTPIRFLFQFLDPFDGSDDGLTATSYTTATDVNSMKKRKRETRKTAKIVQ
jgi:hypothetical protein